MNKGEQIVVDLSTLSIPKLLQLKNQHEQELELFQDSISNLKMVQGKYLESKRSVEQLTPADDGRRTMVPLTGSIYVEGKAKDLDNLLIDIGTGYYARMDQKEALNYFERRMCFVTGEIEKIQSIGMKKNAARTMVTQMLDHRFQQASAGAQSSST